MLRKGEEAFTRPGYDRSVIDALSGADHCGDDAFSACAIIAASASSARARLDGSLEARSFLIHSGALAITFAATSTIRSLMIELCRQALRSARRCRRTRVYNQVDHGYAATIHKSQGVTVDRVHVLATSGLDRHAAYVALSRHRDRVDLHYGEDDFADQGKLVRTLSRERSKDMASDYTSEPGQRFAERRGIVVRERVVEPARKMPERARSIFDGLRLPVQRQEQRPIEPPKAQEEQQRLACRRAVERHARVVTSIFKNFDQGRTADLGQARELMEARKGVDALREHASLDLETAYKKDPALASEAAGGTLNRAAQAMQLEAELRTDPALRADRFVERWNNLRAQSDRAYEACAIDRRKAIQGEMVGMAKSLERDPQLESLLAARKAQLGITFDTGRRLGAELAFNHGIDFGRGRGLGR